MRRPLISVALAALILLIWPATALAAASDPLLATSGNYAVLASATITSAGASWITGQMALSPGTSITGFPPGTSGHQDINDGAALQARNDAIAAYNKAAGEPGCTSTGGVELGSRTLTPGLYCNGTMGISAGLTLTLSGGGIYIFQVGTTLITGASSRVLLTNGAQPCDVFWQVGSSATIGASTTFVGTILANVSITMVTAATLNGRALASLGSSAPSQGSVTLDTNRIIQPGGCSGGFTTNFAPPAFVPPPAGTLLPATLGVPWELVNEVPWLLLIAVGAGIGATMMVVSNRRRRRRSA
ncbi:MAG TPA: ice-binding family protein [Candidatus Acidoferrum sp.]|nr:ice-binding family protein [Candidatus Acidoferrum sp.]